MKQWMISKIPTWVLHYWVWRNWRLVCSGHPRYAFCIEADIELRWRELQTSLGCKLVPRKPPFLIHKYKDRLVIFGPKKPVGIPDWLITKPESYGYEDELDDRFGDKDD